MFASFGLLTIAALSLTPQDRPADEPGPLADGQFRIATVEVGDTPSLRAIEVVVVAPVGSMVSLETRGAGDSGIRSQTRIAGPGLDTHGEFRLLAILSRFPVGGGPLHLEAPGSFALYERAPNGGGSGTTSISLPADAALDERLVPLGEPGDHLVTDVVDLFRFEKTRFEKTTYMIHVFWPDDHRPAGPAVLPGRAAQAANP